MGVWSLTALTKIGLNYSMNLANCLRSILVYFMAKMMNLYGLNEPLKIHYISVFWNTKAEATIDLRGGILL
jgi:hypothetical protein